MRAWYAKLVESFENLRFEVEFIDTTGDHVLLMSAIGDSEGNGAKSMTCRRRDAESWES